MRRALSSRSKLGNRPAAEIRKRVFVWTIAALLAVLVLSFVPTPYYIVAPGNAVDLSSRLTLEGRPPANRHFFLTDVAVAQASVVLLGAGLWPGVRLVRRDTLVPAGESARGFDRSMVEAMDESQAAAAVVAERAAGYAVPEPAQRLVVRSVLPASNAKTILQDGDVVESVGTHHLRDIADLHALFRNVRPGTPVTVTFVRGTQTTRARIATIAGPAGARLGVGIMPLIQTPNLPIPIRYAMGNVAGSSGGLMFALQIYEDLNPGTATDPVAGTGTIALNGTVGPIEGVEQKLIAARRAGIKTFLVPTENYSTIQNESGIKIIPIHTFNEALRSIKHEGDPKSPKTRRSANDVIQRRIPT